MKPELGPAEKNESTEEEEAELWMEGREVAVRKLSSTPPGERRSDPAVEAEELVEDPGPPVKKQYLKKTREKVSDEERGRDATTKRERETHWLTKSEYETEPRFNAPCLGMLKLGS